MALKSNTWIYMRLDLWTILFGPGHYKGPEQFLKYILSIKQWGEREREREREREVVYTTLQRGFICFIATQILSTEFGNTIISLAVFSNSLLS